MSWRTARGKPVVLLKRFRLNNLVGPGLSVERASILALIPCIILCLVVIVKCMQSFELPCEPYSVQVEMMAFLDAGLDASGSEAVPVLAAEVPTGCGKTLAVLSSVLRYQQSLRRLTTKELQEYMKMRRTKVLGNDRMWEPNREILNDFSLGGTAGAKRARSTPDIGKSSALRRRFGAPPCTVFYVSRTHAQIRQVTRELRRLTANGGSKKGVTRPLRMNILGSREHYCINQTLQSAVGRGDLRHESNNLGEICDKLVALQQCPCAEGYALLACSAIDGNGIGLQRQCIWDMEDLVDQGVLFQQCPYYAARDLVFYADVTMCTYPYLLDPIIRHESHFEGALNNNSIIIFDEAHNVPALCEEALSIQGAAQELHELVRCLKEFHEPPPGVTTSLTYNKDFRLSGSQTLVQVFIYLTNFFQAVDNYFAELVQGNVAASVECLLETIARGTHARDLPQLEKNDDVISFRDAYRVIFLLGVTFNPFELPIFIIGSLKKWLVIFRFVYQKPRSFALQAIVPATAPTASSLTADYECDIRCLDGSLAFTHLLQSTHRIIFISGTLSHVQLSRSLCLTDKMWRFMQGSHVVSSSQFSLCVLPRSCTQQPLRCTYSALSSDDFVKDLLETVFSVSVQTVKRGGVIVMVPNYHTLGRMMKIFAAGFECTSLQRRFRVDPSQLFVEPHSSADLGCVLDRFKSFTLRSIAFLFAVYRGKVGEGLDFTDDMARMIICLGIPFRPVNSWQVCKKREFSGEEWYCDDALCAVNQALGRCLRHSNDFGVLLLLDERYCEEQYMKRLPFWCREYINKYDHDEAVSQLQRWWKTWGDYDNAPAPSQSSACPSSLSVSSPVGREEPVIQCFASIPQQRDGHCVSSTAVKLLYEQFSSTTQVDMPLLNDAMDRLLANFYSDPEL